MTDFITVRPAIRFIDSKVKLYEHKDEFMVPFEWGNCPICGDDPCDELPVMFRQYLLAIVRQEREERSSQSYYYTPAYWSHPYITRG